ncbi:microtubule-associated tumor suppressor 1 homolog [Scyliorhinus canicula]|uniref:microtubule-associated tumor suppressor 1 homolog n=1 Tax=Scyliorhinus canicula TaxID=7830 RepID=UPI0018F2BC77|nr:microtubule-associated tumor suppressor 1 homolog [Scyliorhinus canicula]XP_038647021.1 microtubule-associated tumor suppressor 1 homolog [Scyliorhinus canicula]XP_038647022.1 microtubule-associated tumor suppressor 1 homolog [Scyliorhinus canicula]
MKSSLFKMSYQANNSCRMGESSGNERESNFHLPLLINDPNGNGVPCSPGIPPETIHVTTPLTNGNCECPDTQIFSFNIGVDVTKAVSDQVACRFHGIYRPELEMTPDYFCDRETSVVMDPRSSSSDYQHKTANLSWSSKSLVPGQCMLDHKQNHVVKSQFSYRKALHDYLATDIEGTLNTCVKNEADLQKSLGHHVRGDGVKLSIIDGPNDTVRIAMNMERNLGYSMLPSESKLEMKHGNVDSKQPESSVPILESSVFYNESDLSFESQGENEVLNATQIVYQLPLETNLNSKECTVRVSHQQYAQDEAEKILSQINSHDPSTGPIKYPTTFNPDKYFGEEAGHNITDADFYPCVKYKSKETDGQIPVIYEQFEEIQNKMALTEMNETEAYKMPTNSAMNTTFIVLKEVNNDTKSEINSCRSEAQELEAETSIQGTVNDETFSVSSPPTVHEHENSYQTSTPFAGSQKMFFTSSPLHNLSDLSEGDSSAEESPTIMVLQLEGRDSVQKPGFKIKFNANMKPKVEIKSYPKPNFNNIKPKVVSRTQRMSSVSKGSVCRPTEASSKYSPRSTNFISSLDSPCSRSLVPNHRKEPLSKSTLKTKSDIVKIQKIAFRKRISANKPQTLSMTENRTSKSSCGSKPRARASSVSAFADGDQSRVSGSLHFSKPLPSSLGTATCEHKMFQSDGINNVNPSGKTFSAIEKPKARSSSLADALDVHPVSLNPVSVALENPRATQVPLTKPSPNIDDVQVEQKPRSNTRSQTVPSPSAKLRVPSSVSKLRLGSVNNDGHIGKMHGSTSKQPLISDKQKDASIKSKLRTASVTAALNLGASKNTPGSKLPIPASRLQRVNSLSSVSSGVSIQSVQSTCSNKSAVASTNRGGDGPRKGVLSATSRSIQTPCTKTLQKNKVVSVKTPCRGVNRNAITSSQNIPGSSPRPARQLSTSHLKAGRTWVKSCSSTQKQSSRTTCASTRTPPDLLPVVKKSPGLPHFKAKCEKQVEWIALLKELLKTSNQRFEAVAIVLQYLQAQREEVGEQHKELSQELLTLRSELESRNVTFVQLEKNREELRNKYEGVIEKLSEEHQTELEGLQKRLEELFTAEKEHLQQNFNNNVKKLQAQLQKEIEGLTSTHETLKLELSATHSKNLECLQNEYQQSLAELVRSHELEQKTLEESFKERQSLLQDQIRELNEENDSLKEEIKAKEEISKARGQKDQKIDPLSLYLKQELESLKAVLEIKNEKIHNQERKLMQMEKLMEKHTVLDEKLKIVVQENEDLKARMDKHKAVSRQLSTEQVVLQESLQKESKANKRLSMENEELLWKLHNGDVLGPRKLTPTSSLSFQPSDTLVPSSSNPAPSPR